MARRKGKVSQKVMVKAALDEQGWESGPAELGPAIREKFGVDMPNNVISNYKSVLKKELADGTGGKGSGKRGRKPGAAFSDLEAVRGLVDRLGADQVKKLVEVAAMFA